MLTRFKSTLLETKREEKVAHIFITNVYGTPDKLHDDKHNILIGIISAYTSDYVTLLNRRTLQIVKLLFEVI